MGRSLKNQADASLEGMEGMDEWIKMEWTNGMEWNGQQGKVQTHFDARRNQRDGGHKPQSGRTWASLEPPIQRNRTVKRRPKMTAKPAA